MSCTRCHAELVDAVLVNEKHIYAVILHVPIQSWKEAKYLIIEERNLFTSIEFYGGIVGPSRFIRNHSLVRLTIVELLLKRRMNR